MLTRITNNTMLQNGKNKPYLKCWTVIMFLCGSINCELITDPCDKDFKNIITYVQFHNLLDHNFSMEIHYFSRKRMSNRTCNTIYRCPGFVLWWIITTTLFFENASSFCSYPADVVLVPNGLDKLHSYFIEEGDTMFVTCSFTANYTNKTNPDDIIFDVLGKKQLVDKFTKRVVNDSVVQFIYRNISYEAFLKGESKSTMSVLFCCIAGRCKTNINHCEQRKSIQVARKLLPIEHVSCIIPNFGNMSCSWEPSIEIQKNHTGVHARLEKLKVKQYLHYKSPNMENWTEVEVVKGATKSIPDLKYIKDQVYYIKIEVSDLFENKESKVVVVNTTEIVQMSPVSSLAICSSPGSRSICLSWKWPEVPNQLTQYLEANITWTGWKITKWHVIEVVANTSSGKKHRFELDNLVPFTNYKINVSVKIKTSKQWSEIEQLLVKTDTEKPEYNPVYNVNCYSLDRKGTKSCSPPCVPVCGVQDCQIVTLYWKLLQKMYFYGTNFQYQVQYNAGKQGWKNATWLTDIKNSKILQVPSLKQVQIRILSKNDKGLGPLNGTVCNIPEQGKELKVNELTVESNNGSDINLQWEDNKDLVNPKYYLYWCAKWNKVKAQKCLDGYNLSWIKMNTPPPKNGIYKYSTEQGELLHNSRRVKRSANSWFNEQLFGVSVKAETSQGVQTSGIVWSKVMYLNTKLAVIPSEVKAVSFKVKSLTVSWEYNCEDVCARPQKFVVYICPSDPCKQDEDWKKYNVPNSHLTFTKGDLKPGKYLVKVEAVGPVQGDVIHLSQAEAVEVKSPFLKPAYIALFVVGAIICLIFVALGLMYLARKFIRRKEYWNLNIELPDIGKRREMNSTSSRNHMLASQSSSDYARQLSQNSDDSTAPLFRSRYNGDTTHHLPTTREDDDEVFENGFSNPYLNQTPLQQSYNYNSLPPPQPCKYPVNFDPIKVMNVPDGYLNTQLPTPKPEPSEPGDIVPENIQGYCQVALISGKDPVERDDREGQNGTGLDKSSDLMFLGNDSMKDNIINSSGQDRPDLDVVERFEQPKNVTLPEELEGDILPNVNKKYPTEDYWKSSTSGSDIGFNKDGFTGCMSDTDLGKGFSESYLDKEKDLEFDDKPGKPEENTQDDFDKPATDIVFTPTKQVSRSHDYLDKNAQFSLPNGGVSFSKGKAVECGSSEYVNQPAVQPSTAVTNNKPNTAPEQGYISMEELPFLAKNVQNKNKSAVPSSKSMPLHLNQAAANPYISMDDLQKMTGSNSSVSRTNSSLPSSTPHNKGTEDSALPPALRGIVPKGLDDSSGIVKHLPENKKFIQHHLSGGQIFTATAVPCEHTLPSGSMGTVNSEKNGRNICNNNKSSVQDDRCNHKVTDEKPLSEITNGDIKVPPNVRPIFKSYREFDDRYSWEDPSDNGSNIDFNEGNDPYCKTEICIDGLDEPVNDESSIMSSASHNHHDDDDNSSDIDGQNINNVSSPPLQKQSSDEDTNGNMYCATKMKKEAEIKGQISRTPSSVGVTPTSSEHNNVMGLMQGHTNGIESTQNEMDYVPAELSFEPVY